MPPLAPCSTLFPYTTLFRSHREGWAPTWFGDSVGHWEGDTLVIEVVNLNGYARLSTIGQPMSDQAKITMYFTRPDYGHIDRKSTRLNSSHRCISYAVFCLKK